MPDAGVALTSHDRAIHVVIDYGVKTFVANENTIKPASRFHHDVRVSSTIEQTAIAVSADGKILALASDDGNICTLELPRYSLLFRGALHSQGVTDVFLSTDGRLVCTTGRDHVAIVWEARTGKLVQTVRCVMAAASAPLPEGKRANNPRRKHHVRALRFARAGTLLVSGETAANGGWVVIWQWQPSPTNPAEPYVPVSSARVCRDALTGMTVDEAGQRIAVTSSEGHITVLRVHGTTMSTVWTSESAFPSLCRVDPPHILPVTGMQFAPSGRYLITASADRSVAVWDTRPRSSLRWTVWAAFILLLILITGVTIWFRSPGVMQDRSGLLTESPDMSRARESLRPQRKRPDRSLAQRESRERRRSGRMRQQRESLLGGMRDSDQCSVDIGRVLLERAWRFQRSHCELEDIHDGMWDVSNDKMRDSGQGLAVVSSDLDVTTEGKSLPTSDEFELSAGVDDSTGGSQDDNSERNDTDGDSLVRERADNIPKKVDTRTMDLSSTSEPSDSNEFSDSNEVNDSHAANDLPDKGDLSESNDWDHADHFRQPDDLSKPSDFDDMDTSNDNGSEPVEFDDSTKPDGSGSEPSGFDGSSKPSDFGDESNEFDDSGKPSDNAGESNEFGDSTIPDVHVSEHNEFDDSREWNDASEASDFHHPDELGEAEGPHETGEGALHETSEKGTNDMDEEHLNGDDLNHDESNEDDSNNNSSNESVLDDTTQDDVHDLHASDETYKDKFNKANDSDEFNEANDANELKEMNESEDYFKKFLDSRNSMELREESVEVTTSIGEGARITLIPTVTAAVVTAAVESPAVTSGITTPTAIAADVIQSGAMTPPVTTTAAPITTADVLAVEVTPSGKPVAATPTPASRTRRPRVTAGWATPTLSPADATPKTAATASLFVATKVPASAASTISATTATPIALPTLIPGPTPIIETGNKKDQEQDGRAQRLSGGRRDNSDMLPGVDEENEHMRMDEETQDSAKPMMTKTTTTCQRARWGQSMFKKRKCIVHS